MNLDSFKRTVAEFVQTRSFGGGARELVLVQIRDEDGFWSNVQEFPAIRPALEFAQAYAEREQCAVQVVRGHKRELVRHFTGGSGRRQNEAAS